MRVCLDGREGDSCVRKWRGLAGARHVTRAQRARAYALGKSKVFTIRYPIK